MKTSLAVACFAIVLLAAGPTAHASRANVPLAPFVATPSPVPAPTARALWRYVVPGSQLGRGPEPLESIRVNGRYVALSGTTGLIVVDALTGKRQWRAPGASGKIVLDSAVIFNADANGGVVARRLSDGARFWRAPACAPPKWNPSGGGIDVLARYGADLMVGCRSGDVVRLDAATGATAAVSSPIEVYSIDSIVPLGACAYAVTASIELFARLRILDCEHLRDIIPMQSDTNALAAIGSSAILDDWCCGGRPDRYQPATIAIADLGSGKISPEIDLTPDPQLHPANQQRLGQGEWNFMAGGALYLPFDTMLYQYPNALDLSAPPKPLLTDLAERPQLLANGDLFVRERRSSGAIVDRVLDLNARPMRILWSAPEKSAPFVPSDQSAPSGVLIAGSGYSPEAILAKNGSRLITVPGCNLAASDDRTLVIWCANPALIGYRDPAYAVAYRWPSVKGRRPQKL